MSVLEEIARHAETIATDRNFVVHGNSTTERAIREIIRLCAPIPDAPKRQPHPADVAWRFDDHTRDFYPTVTKPPAYRPCVGCGHSWERCCGRLENVGDRCCSACAHPGTPKPAASIEPANLGLDSTEADHEPAWPGFFIPQRCTATEGGVVHLGQGACVPPPAPVAEKCKWPPSPAGPARRAIEAAEPEREACVEGEGHMGWLGCATHNREVREALAADATPVAQATEPRAEGDLKTHCGMREALDAQALAEIAKDVDKSCIQCHGSMTYEPECWRCRDSTDDHHCPPSRSCDAKGHAVATRIRAIIERAAGRRV